jgi:tetratricopeptide (TPR) repeat protein
MPPCRLALACLVLASCRPTMMNDTTPPDLDARWDFGDPAASEAIFRSRLPAAAAGDPGRHAELLTQIARAEGLQRRFDAAHATLDEAEAIAAASPRARVRVRLERGRVLNSAGAAEDARPHFLAAWEEARAAGIDGLAVDAAHMVAIVESGDGALEWNERALALADSSSDPDARRWRGSLLNNIGWAHHGRGAYEPALRCFEAALDARRESGRPEDVRVARWCVARCLRSLGRVEEALREQRRLQRELAATGATDGYVEEELAECLLALDRGVEARPHFARAHELLSADPWLVEGEPERLERLRRLSE